MAVTPPPPGTALQTHSAVSLMEASLPRQSGLPGSESASVTESLRDFGACAVIPFFLRRRERMGSRRSSPKRKDEKRITKLNCLSLSLLLYDCLQHKYSSTTMTKTSVDSSCCDDSTTYMIWKALQCERTRTWPRPGPAFWWLAGSHLTH